MVIRDSVTAKANCSWLTPLNLPDSASVTGQANTSSTTVITISTGSSIAIARSAKAIPAGRPGPSGSETLWLNIGMNAEANAPSANSARNMFGRRKATRNASEAKLAPM